MKYCRYCGQQLDDNCQFCNVCGKKCDDQQSVNNSINNDESSLGFAVLCFFFPIVGLILYLVWIDTYPLRAKSCGKGALIGFVTSIVLSICYACFIFSFFDQIYG